MNTKNVTAAPAGGGLDVLAVMQASADQLWRYRRDILAREEEEARAAIAELIEAVSDVYGEPDGDVAMCEPGCMSCRIRAALAKVANNGDTK